MFFLLFHFPFYRPNRYADVWNGKADAEAHEAAAFLNSTENSPAHGVHVASYIIAAMGHGSLIDMMNYHSFIEGFELHITSPTIYKPNIQSDNPHFTSIHLIVQARVTRCSHQASRITPPAIACFNINHIITHHFWHQRCRDKRF